MMPRHATGYGQHALTTPLCFAGPRAGTPVEVMQQKLGHKSLDVATHYVTSDDANRMAALRGFWKNS